MRTHQQHQVVAFADLFQQVPLSRRRHAGIGLTVAPGRCIQHHCGVAVIAQVGSKYRCGGCDPVGFAAEEQHIGTGSPVTGT